ncbi:MAG TPA: hypothetical protein VMH28_00295 [Candidatus Acidoferrales bacterium]|nr:hypothetical protein [Candidatus Acidoferrales bacterium]
MPSISRIAAAAAVFAGLACAETWSGRLLDASCVDQQKSASCDPAGSSVTFAINVSGRIYKLDDAGNAKAVEALKSRADRSKDPAMTNSPVNAKVTGSLEGDIVKVETIQVQ